MIFRNPLLARFFALTALLCVLGLQLGETWHSHGLDEPVVECLFCKGSAGTDITAQAVPPSQYSVAIAQFFYPAAAPVHNGPCLAVARGPPTHS